VPELPEVETVRRGLSPVMQGQLLSKVDVNRPDLRWPLPENMSARLAGTTVVALRRRSKYILADLSSGETLIIHLGMSGRILIEDAPIGEFHHNPQTRDRHDHVVFYLGTGKSVAFNDPRRFGHMDLASTEDVEDHWLLNKLGPEPLGNGFNEDYLAARLNGRNTPIKSALLDQRIVAGLGNIYVCEALFRAGISPLRKAKNISAARISRLVGIIRDVLEEAIASGGSSLRDYRQADGELGYFQHTFRVYDREAEHCTTPDCGDKIKRVVQSGRSSFYCPSCQR